MRIRFMLRDDFIQSDSNITKDDEGRSTFDIKNVEDLTVEDEE